jgi:hypothetical protein
MLEEREQQVKVTTAEHLFTQAPTTAQAVAAALLRLEETELQL